MSRVEASPNNELARVEGQARVIASAFERNAGGTLEYTNGRAVLCIPAVTGLLHHDHQPSTIKILKINEGEEYPFIQIPFRTTSKTVHKAIHAYTSGRETIQIKVHGRETPVGTRSFLIAVHQALLHTGVRRKEKRSARTLAKTIRPAIEEMETGASTIPAAETIPLPEGAKSIEAQTGFGIMVPGRDGGIEKTCEDSAIAWTDDWGRTHIVVIDGVGSIEDTLNSTVRPFMKHAHRTLNSGRSPVNVFQTYNGEAHAGAAIATITKKPDGSAEIQMARGGDVEIYVVAPTGSIKGLADDTNEKIKKSNLMTANVRSGYERRTITAPKGSLVIVATDGAYFRGESAPTKISTTKDGRRIVEREGANVVVEAINQALRAGHIETISEQELAKMIISGTNAGRGAKNHDDTTVAVVRV